ncbi:MAG: bifunctional [glutamine synthetase] adenylyltransferase/[glutamine synthetase]-adenylyl-L-tyrosine phosphorylase [Alphaproteobacteria bacterium]|nr:bifunctional [glutamine synthetase] adenylyltransferase/[glutamine synthetase]-adenylyl-L-tyrosine phosphorylase [Alphaproteobacteria bacterium]
MRTPRTRPQRRRRRRPDCASGHAPPAGSNRGPRHGRGGIRRCLAALDAPRRLFHLAGLGRLRPTQPGIRGLLAHLVPDPAGLPPPADPSRARDATRALAEEMRRLDDPADQAFGLALLSDPVGHALAATVFGNSPYLGRLLLAHPTLFLNLGRQGLRSTMAEVTATLVWCPEDDEAGLARRLRQAKAQAALLVAIADIAGAWPVDEVTRALSAVADAAVEAVAAFLLDQGRRSGDLRLPDSSRPTAGSGYIVVGMGKLGARELNYSSDIDLISLYDDEVVSYHGAADAQTFFVRLTRRLVGLLQDRSRHGYLFRTDLRLRPDPGATPVALSTTAAELYYESLGQNWERAALIKARVVGGDHAAGERFLARLVPFIWRKHLDFAAIQDIHSIKRQINAHRGGDRIAVFGHNIKLGRGGIREIEFFAQTQQLIWGGRKPALRLRATCDALQALVAQGLTEASVATELTAAYRLLRRVEHHLQMIADEQTHRTPAAGPAFAALATFLGYASPEAFAEALRAELERVEYHYARLFEQSPELTATGNLVFTGTDDDPDTLASLTRLGFHEAPAIAAMVRGWHRGRVRATRSTRARELLTELMPHLLAAFGATANPDSALLRFNDFMARLPEGVQIFSLLFGNPHLLEFLAEVFGNAPTLAEALARNVLLLDAVLSPEFHAALPTAETLRRDLGETLAPARDMQDVLDALRRWTHDRQFQAGVHLLKSSAAPEDVARLLSDTADAVLVALLGAVEGAFAEVHGRVPGGAFAVVALGKLGSREMSIGSDLDLIFIYEADPDATASDGAKPLPSVQYFSRLAQRYLTAITARTPAGGLFDIDMRLRPSGNKGPIAVDLAAFRTYQRTSAWTWEHMVLTRARVIAGPESLAARIDRLVGEVLATPRAPATLRRDVAEMRTRIAHEHGTADPWNLKYVRGGLIDLDFIAQYLQLAYAAAAPHVLRRQTAEAFLALAQAGLLDTHSAATLNHATRLMSAMQAILRLTREDARIEEAPAGLQATLAKAAGVGDFQTLKAALLATQAAVRALYDTIVGEPGDHATSQEGT